MATKGKARVLYFVKGMTPTPDQVKDAESMGTGVSFRNANMVHDTDPLEHADLVAGDVPEIYRRAYARPSDYANAFSRGAPSGPLPPTQTDADVQRAADAAHKAGASPAPAPQVPAKGKGVAAGDGDKKSGEPGWGVPSA